MKLSKSERQIWLTKILSKRKDCYNLRAFVYNFFGRKLYPNQWYALRDFLDPKVKRVLFSTARQAGKTEVIALACAILPIFYDNIHFYIFAPKLEQAQISFDRFSGFIHNNPYNIYAGAIVVDKADRIKFANGTEIRAVTASRNAEIEGLTVHIILLEECVDGKTKISIDQHYQKTIKEIVEKKLPLKIMSYNKKTGQIEKKRIVNYFKKPLYSGKLYKIKIKTEKGIRVLKCTGEHKVMTKRGLIKAKNLLKSDRVLYR